MNIAAREEENLLPSFPHSILEFLRFTSLSFKKKSASTINPRCRWDKALLKGENIPQFDLCFCFFFFINNLD